MTDSRSAVPRPRRPAGWSPARPGSREPVPSAASAGHGLLTWADQDEGCLVLLEATAGGEPVVRWVNRTGAQLLGYDPDELLGERLPRLLRSPFAAALSEGEDDAPLVDPRRVVRRSLLLQRRDGSPLRVALTTVPLGDGEAVTWVLRLVPEPDIDRVAADLRTSHERFRALADRAPIGIFSSESGLRLAYVNDSFTSVFADTAERLVGTGWLARVHVDDRPDVIDAVTGVLGGVPAELPMRVVRPTGEQRLVQARIVPVPSARRDVGFVGTLEDVTERRAVERSLDYQAAHDPLTGLLNRRRLLELLSRQLERRPASVSAGAPALLFLDLDDFKHVNDSLGHDAGDLLLQEVAARLRREVRDGDVVSRFGGDEFAVLCQVADEQQAGELAARLLASVTGSVLLGARSVRVSASIGVVVAGRSYVEAEDVLRDADVAMYQAKSAGKDCWALFDEQARRLVQDRVELGRELRLALDAQELTVHYQPVVGLQGPGLDTAPLVSVEALARWPHAVRGMVPPDEFIDVAEEIGLVGAVGEQVLRAACRQMVRWQQVLGPLAPASVSVNVSARQMGQADLPETVAQVLAETGLPGSSLCLELTETVVMNDTAQATASFRRLHEMGVRVAIDDFGTGYSSLSVLRQLPFDLLKIDRSLLPDLSAETHDPVVAAVVALARALGLDVVAEGVETVEQVAELRRLGCPLAQGYLFGRPMAPEQLEAWVREREPVAGRAATA